MSLHAACTTALVLTLAMPTAADEPGYVFPADAGVIDVTQPPYDADPTGQRDSTEAIQRALSQHASGNRIIYLPHGTYLVTDTLRWPEGTSEGGYMKRTIMQGQSAAGTVIRLPDATPGFGDPAKPKPLTNTGRAPAQRFRNAIRHLTVEVGADNPGAIGIQYVANNQGTVRDVTIRSLDPQRRGFAGLDLGVPEQGPCLIRDVRVEGFDIGIRTDHGVNSVTMEHIQVSGQRVAGMLNHQQIVTVRGLTSRNAVPAVINRGGGLMFTLIEADLRGEGDATGVAAVQHEAGFLFARDIKTSGYAMAIDNRSGHRKSAAAGDVAEFTSHAPHVLFEGTEASTLRLPIKETPDVAWDPIDQWAGPHHFGGSKAKDFDNTAALQAAIDSGATTLYLPNGVWPFHGEVVVRGNVRRIIGCEAKLDGKGTLRIADGTSDIVRLERIELLYGDVLIHHATKRTLVLSSVTFGNRPPLTDDGAGDLFLEDVCVGELRLKNQNVWARQFNPESRNTKIINDGGNLWMLGLKTEQKGTAVHATGGGKSEILGYFCYANSGDEKPPLFIVEEGSSLSMNYAEMVIRKQPFRTIVQETRGGETRTLGIDDTPGRGGGSAVVLFTARP